MYPLLRQYRDRLAKHRAEGITDPALQDYRWLLEELRVSLFAQGLRTAVPVSEQKVQKLWTQVRP
jgi:ATP-dependent helicase HrpA